MNLTTHYLGLELKNPLVPSASPLMHELDTIKRLEDAGASAVVLHSLFEEQIRHESRELDHHMTAGTESFAEALTYFPEPSEFRLGPEEYLEHIRKAKGAASIPIIASLNGTTPGGWTGYAKKMEEAGADALELNLYSIPTDRDASCVDVEKAYLEVVRAVKGLVGVPVAVKLSPFFTNTARAAADFVSAGANGLVLFNRFYQPDIDLKELEVKPDVSLSTSADIRLPLRWIAILYGRVEADFAATGGVHTHEDVLKLLMAGAKVTMLCAALLKKGPGELAVIERGLREWMEKNEYDSVVQMQGSMSQRKVGDPTAFERAQYMRTLRSWKPVI
ncbi:MAG: dihydroorotate dehydrogenase-like protein [Candidatus Eisenbacteria bacterium]|nr:dihydroorotate dehydrogenase-like protein [Candidatus Eisenbacteria bacterium]